MSSKMWIDETAERHGWRQVWERLGEVSYSRDDLPYSVYVRFSVLERVVAASTDEKQIHGVSKAARVVKYLIEYGDKS